MTLSVGGFENKSPAISLLFNLFWERPSDEEFGEGLEGKEIMVLIKTSDNQSYASNQTFYLLK